MTTYFLKSITLGSLLLVSIAGCSSQSPMHGFNDGDPIIPLSQKEKILKDVHFDALEQMHSDIKKGELAQAEKNYVDSPTDLDAAFEYVKLLRKVGMLDQAKLILQPFAIDSELATEGVLLEYAKIQLQMGSYDTAQIFAQEATFMDDSAQSNMILGVALDSQGHHEAAEKNYRTALDNVGLDIEMRNKILNNLALCLLVQGRQVEAQEVLNMVDAGALDGDSLLKFDANTKLAFEA